MATGNVAEPCGEGKRGPERLEHEMVPAVSRYASALLSASDPADAGTHPARLDDRLRRRVASAARDGLQAALETDASDCGAPPDGGMIVRVGVPRICPTPRR